jgi:hypothetical protein
MMVLVWLKSMYVSFGRYVIVNKGCIEIFTTFIKRDDRVGLNALRPLLVTDPLSLPGKGASSSTPRVWQVFTISTLVAMVNLDALSLPFASKVCLLLVDGSGSSRMIFLSRTAISLPCFIFLSNLYYDDFHVASGVVIGSLPNSVDQGSYRTVANSQACTGLH